MLQRFQAFVTGITACYKYIQRIKLAQMSEWGLKGNHAMYLFLLYHSGEALTAAQLCGLCMHDKAAVSRAVALLQEKGLIETVEKKYRAPLHLTDAGIQLVRQLDAVIGQWVEFGGAGLTEEERTVFYDVLGRISENLSENVEKSLL